MADAPAGLRARMSQDGPIPLDARLACAPGEMLALAGPSGSGKSTVLRIIAGLYRPKNGRIACNGEDWYDSRNGVNLPPRHRRVGFVFQNYALFPHMSAIDNVIEALGESPRHKRRERARELLDLVNLSGLEHRRPAALSGGQQQRVAVARALARNPNVLLLDEPFSAVDKATRQKLYRELANLRRQLSMPIILVTHDLDEAALLADRLSILHRGRTLQSGPPVAVMTRPESVEVARLVDLKNIFTGTIVEHRPENGITRLAWAGHTLEARYQPDFAADHAVAWSIPAAQVILHRRDRPSRGERENPVPGTVTEVIVLGERVSVAVRVDGDPERPMFMSIPTHVASRNRITVGAQVCFSLLTEGIHLMPLAA